MDDPSVHINAGLRFDYLNAKLESQSFPAGTFVPARTAGEITDLPSWKDLGPRLGLAWDVHGNGKTAIKTTLSRYVASQTVGFASQFNPLGGTVTGAGFSGTGADTRMWTDPNGDRIVQLSELGPTSNPFFGTNFRRRPRRPTSRRDGSSAGSTGNTRRACSTS